LHTGNLQAHLREDIAFVPHITIAAHTDVRWCDAYAEQLNATLQPVRGVIESVTLVDVTATKITSLARFVLGAPASSQP
jgi:2'-5' RNA ligase